MISFINLYHIQGKRSFENIFYPQMFKSKIPIDNPNGKYILKLFINGEYKAIIIDDVVIISSTGQYSSPNFANELIFTFDL